MNKKTNTKVPQHRLREFRVLPRITQWELSLRSGIKQSRISLIENYLVTPTTREKIKLSNALNQSIDVIFPNNAQTELTANDTTDATAEEKS